MAREKNLHLVVSLLVLFSMFFGNFIAAPQPVLADTASLTIPFDSETERDTYFLNLLGGKEPATDSASAATAISTGYKTDDGNLAWLPGDPVTGSLTTIAETLRTDLGFAIGVASTVQFSHATPAGFVSHNVSRNNYADIANEIINTIQPEVVIGGGHPGFNDGDYRYVGGEATWAELNNGLSGYTHIVTRMTGVDGGDALITSAMTVSLTDGDKLIGVFGGPGSNFEYHTPSDTPGTASITPGSTENPLLADVVNASLSVLDQDSDGFFVMFEQGDIDWSNHANDFASMVGGVWDLDEAVKAAETYVNQNGGPDWTNTLIIVTSDHSNSFMRLPYPLGLGDLPNQIAGGGAGDYGGGSLYPNGDVTYRTGNHTNELVTLSARGQSAYLFNEYMTAWYAGARIMDNSQIYEVMHRAAVEAGADHIILFIGDGMNIEHEIAASRYLYGSDFALAWHDWGQLPNGWAGYVATWDVTTYNKYAASLGQPSYVIPTAPASIGVNDATIGYDPTLGGASPFPIGLYNSLIADERNAYFLTPLGSGYGAQPATDSASAATALSTGYKTDDGNIAWLPGDPVTGSLTTIAEELQSNGFAIGVASTVQFSHATPAGFVSHNVSRNNYAAIANEIINTIQPDVVIGGGHPGFNGGNYSYVGGEATWTALNTGLTSYTNVVTRTPGVDGGDALIAEAASVSLLGGDKLMGVFGGPGSNFEYHIPSDTPGAPSITQGSTENPLLADVVTATLGVLGQDSDGLFVMFEHGDIDWSNHANDFRSMVGGVWDLDLAVKAAQAFVEQPGGPSWDDTLIIVTSDHSNSYMRIRIPLSAGDLPAQSGTNYPDGEVTYGTTGHTNELVTLWARGHNANLFADSAGDWYAGTNIVDNTQIYEVMMDAVDAGTTHIILFIGDGMNIEHEIAASRYLYGTNDGLAWHGWGDLADGWAGYAATWDVTTYNRYAPVMGQPVYNLNTFDPIVGYNPAVGGYAPYPIQPDQVFSDGILRDGYNLTGATDSASAATALSTGYKTDDGNLAWLPGDPVTGSLTTIAETLGNEMGYAIGVASTVQFSHATPAGFVSHNVSRNNYSAIANEIINTTQPEVVIGGGHPDFNGIFNYVGGLATWQAINQGETIYTHIVTRTVGVDGGDALLAAAASVDLDNGDRLIGVFGGPGSNFEYHIPSDTPGTPSFTQGSIENPLLADVVNASLDVLSQDPDGFFVMFEQGDIDWSNHANDYASMVGGVWDLDQAVLAAESFVDQAGGPTWDDTLVIVTSDHANSYLRNRQWLGLGDLPLQIFGGVPGASTFLPTYPDGEITYQSSGHTNELVTLWARGEGAELFAAYAGEWYANDNIVDNTQIYQVMLAAARDLGVQHIVLFIGDGMNIEHEIAASRYLYGVDQGLAWHNWRNLTDGWGGYASTWDVSTYNVYAGLAGEPAYDMDTFDALIGYDPMQGGSAPYRLQPFDATLEAAPTSLYVELDAGGIVTETITITKTGSSNVSWQWLEDPAVDWLTTDPASGIIAFDGAVDLDMVVDATGMTAGFYRTSLTFNNPFLDIIIPVVLKVRATGAAPTASNAIEVNFLASYRPGIAGASEIITYDPENHLLYVTNGVSTTLDVLSIADIGTVPTPTLVTSIDLSAYGAGITSVAYSNGLVTAAVPSDPHTDKGVVVLIQNGVMVSVTVGALPDMLTFTPDGSKLLVANEGEPNSDYTIDPEGSISVIDVSGGITATTQAQVTQLGFTAFNAPAVIDPAIRIYGPNATVAQDLEPEYIAVSPDSKTAWVTLQENNALAVVNLETLQITQLVALGSKDWSALGLDASDRDNAINITNWEVKGLYQPDAIAAYTVGGTTYLVTANEGDSRDYAGYSEETRIGSLTLDADRYPAAYAAAIKANAALGRLKTTKAVKPGDTNLYTYGARSFSIWNGTTGTLVYDSGADFERITAAQTPDLFNANSGDPAEKDTRSDDKGPEAESVVLGVIAGRTYAFVGLERGPGGVMVYDVTNPLAPVFVRYVPSEIGDISPEGLTFIPAEHSPTGNALLVIAHELTGSTSVYEIPVETPQPTVHLIYMPLIAK